MTIRLATLVLTLVTTLGQSPIAGARDSTNERATIPSPTYQFINGLWFDGKNFRPATFYSLDGYLTRKRPKRVDQVVDLSGKYVVPPFGEAHNHNVAQGSRIDTFIRMYLEAGIFYVKNPNSLPRTTTPLSGKINLPSSIDVVFANGGLTGSGGHPVGLVRLNISRGVMREEDGEGAFYYTIDNQADLDRKWESIVSGRPDFIKTYLLYSEEYEKRKNDVTYDDWKGLNPALLPEIVRRAHRASLPVSTHVETGADFHTALLAGVDEVNHLPGFRPEKNNPANYRNLSRYEISEADARLAARNHVIVVTTVGDTLEAISKIDERSPQAPLAKAVRDLITRNLQLLARYHVQVAIGSDSYSRTSLPEAMNLHRLKVFDNLTLLKMWCETTPKAIFPKRKIGQLRDGYEASFLVLVGDPIQDFTNVKKIEMRIKQGQVLSLSK